MKGNARNRKSILPEAENPTLNFLVDRSILLQTTVADPLATRFPLILLTANEQGSSKTEAKETTFRE